MAGVSQRAISGGNGGAELVSFNDGGVLTDDGFDGNYVRAVRGGP